MRDIDLLIYAPHGDDNALWIQENQPYLSFNHPVPTELLRRYQSHEADRWSNEIAEVLHLQLSRSRPDKRIEVLTGKIPRAWIDLNRPWERALPPVLQPCPAFLEAYNAEIQQAITLHKRAKKVLHIHTMCGKSPRYNWTLHPEVQADDLEEFLMNCYSWEKRSIDLLFETDTWRTVGSPSMIGSILSEYQKSQFPITTHGTYILKEHYPATELLDLSEWCLIEFPKPLLSTDSSCEHIDTSRLILDMEKIEKHALMLSNALWRILT